MKGERVRNENRKNTTLLITSFAIFSILFVSCSHALTLGDIPPTKKIVELRPGESIRIPMGFFTTGKEDVVVTLQQLTPIEISSTGRDLSVYFLDNSNRIISKVKVEGNTATVSPSAGGHWTILGDGKTYVKVTDVYIHISVPQKTTFVRNRYDLMISAKAVSPYISTGGISQKIGQERQYTITVLIKDVYLVPPAYKEAIQEQSNQTANTSSFMDAFLSHLVSRFMPAEEEKQTVSLGTSDNYVTSDVLDQLKTRGAGSVSSGKVPRLHVNEGTEKSSEKITGKLTMKDITKSGPVNKGTIIIIILGLLLLRYIWIKLD